MSISDSTHPTPAGENIGNRDTCMFVRLPPERDNVSRSVLVQLAEGGRFISTNDIQNKDYTLTSLNRFGDRPITLLDYRRKGCLVKPSVHQHVNKPAQPSKSDR